MKTRDCYGTVMERVKQSKIAKAQKEIENRDISVPGGKYLI